MLLQILINPLFYALSEQNKIYNGFHKNRSTQDQTLCLTQQFPKASTEKNQHQQFSLTLKTSLTVFGTTIVYTNVYYGTHSSIFKMDFLFFYFFVPIYMNYIIPQGCPLPFI